MAVLLVGLVVLVQIVLGLLDVLVERFLHHSAPHLERQPLVMGGINLVAFGAAVAIGLRLNRLPFRRAFPVGRITVFQVVGVAITLLGTDVLLSDADNVLRALLPVPHWLAEFFEDVIYTKNALFSRIVLLVIVAPVTEELLFRGIILRGFLSRHRPTVAVVLTAVLFAALHANPWQFVSSLFLGIAFGWFYMRTGSVWLCVLAHAFSNGLAIACTLLPVDLPGLVGTSETTSVVFQPWWLDLSGLVLLLVGLPAFIKASPATPASTTPAPPVTGAT